MFFFFYLLIKYYLFLNKKIIKIDPDDFSDEEED